MGGTWLSQNKVRPGAYINFSSVPRPSTTVGDRGIATMALPLSWGAEGELIDVYSTDLLDGSSLASVGMTAFDAESKLLRLMLSGCYLAKIYRLNSGGARAVGAVGELLVRAKHPGEFGNEITIAVTATGALFTVTTYVSGASRDSQTVALVGELDNNDFVEFSGSGALTPNAGFPLEGGTDGTVQPSTAYPAYLALAMKARWQTMALTQDTTQYNPIFAEFAETMRETEGRFVQVALSNYAGADYPGVINSDCGVGLADGSVVTADEAAAWVAGITAGASVIQSNGSRPFPDAIRILNERTNSEIIDALKAGMFILSTNQRGDIKVEDDINSLHTFTPARNRDWRLNQVVRVLDEIGTTVSDIWEQSYQHKVQNNDNGRMIFKADIIGYFNQLMNLGAITDFAGADDIVVDRGMDLDAVTADVLAQPVAAMSKLYMQVNVKG